MYVDIISPDAQLFSGEAELLQLPGESGLFAVLNNHAPIVSTLKEGNVKVIDLQKQTHYFAVKGGVMEMKDNKATVLAE